MISKPICELPDKRIVGMNTSDAEKKQDQVERDKKEAKRRQDAGLPPETPQEKQARQQREEQQGK